MDGRTEEGRKGIKISKERGKRVEGRKEGPKCFLRICVCVCVCACMSVCLCEGICVYAGAKECVCVFL